MKCRYRDDRPQFTLDPAIGADRATGRDETRAQAIKLERQQRIRNYMSALRQQASIKDFRAELFRTAAQAEAAAERVRAQTGQNKGQ